MSKLKDLILKQEEFHVLLTKTTKQPYVICDPVTYDDCVYIFSKPEASIAYVNTLDEKRKAPLYGAAIKTNSIRNFWNSLYFIGVNAVCFNDGKETEKVDLSELAPVPDFSLKEGEVLPKANPSLSLSMIYYLQELRSLGKDEFVKLDNAKDISQEVIINMRRSNWIVLGDISEVTEEMDSKEKLAKTKMIYLKRGEDVVAMAAFSDLLECQKFIMQNKDMKLSMRAVPFKDLTKFLVSQATGVVFNPLTFDLYMDKKYIEDIAAGGKL